MSRLTLSTHTAAVCGSIIVLLAAGGIILAAHSQPTTTNSAGKTTRTTATKSSTKKTTPSLSSTNKTTNLTTSNTSAADKAANAAANVQPVTDACNLLTLSIAQQLLGTGTKSSMPGDTSSLQATDTSLSACAYANGSSSVQVIIRTPTSSVGASENDTVFGSGKPTNAITTQGYGQSAYWDPGKDTLNVLGSNNWYIISRSSPTQADAEAAANLLKSGF